MTSLPKNPTQDETLRSAPIEAGSPTHGAQPKGCLPRKSQDDEDGFKWNR